MCLSLCAHSEEEDDLMVVEDGDQPPAEVKEDRGPIKKRRKPSADIEIIDEEDAEPAAKRVKL